MTIATTCRHCGASTFLHQWHPCLGGWTWLCADEVIWRRAKPERMDST